MYTTLDVHRVETTQKKERERSKEDEIILIVYVFHCALQGNRMNVRSYVKPNQ